MNLQALIETGPTAASGEDGRFSLAELEAVALAGRGFIAEALLDGVIARCAAAGAPVDVTVDGEAASVDLAPACAALAGWDGRVSAESTGAQVWREMVGSGLFTADDVYGAGGLWATDFDPADPVATPGGLADPEPEGDRVLQALATALVRLERAGVAPDAPLGALQHLQKGDVRHPVPGGQDAEGVMQIASWSSGASGTLLEDPGRGTVINSATDLTDRGYPVNYGNSYVLAVSFTPEGPQARALTVYSQAEHEGSPHFDDQTALAASGALRAVRFAEADIAADPALRSVTVTLP
jgi:acyl-homoserine-lactone acylase